MPLNEELLSKFTQNELGDLYFEDKLIVKRDQVAPESPVNLSISDITYDSFKVSFDPSLSDDVLQYRVEVAYQTYEPHLFFETTTTTCLVTGLKSETYYDIRVVALDPSGNRSPILSSNNSVVTGVAPYPPNIDAAHIAWWDMGGRFVFTFYEFPGATEIDVYVNDVFVETVQARGWADYSGFPYEYNKEYTIKAIARNAYGEAQPVSITVKKES